jgi:hypothetical protein
MGERFQLQSKKQGNRGGAIYCALALVSWAFCWSSFSSAAFRGTNLTVSLSTLPVNRNGSAELASNGFTTPRGLPYSASAVASMCGFGLQVA